MKCQAQATERAPLSSTVRARMKPHGRIVLASAAFSVALAAALAAFALAATYWLESVPAADSSSDGDVRGAGVMLVVGVPIALILSFLVALPFTYVAWERRPISWRQVLAMVIAASVTPAVPLAYVGMGLSFVPLGRYMSAFAVMTLVAVVVFGLSASTWWFVAPRALTTRSSGPC